MSDYPDWQAFPTAQGSNLFTSYFLNLAPGAHPGPIFPVVNWSSMTVSVSTQTGSAVIAVNHYADKAGTQQITADSWNVNNKVQLLARVPLRGPYAQVSVQATGAVNFQALAWASMLSAGSEHLAFPLRAQNTGQLAQVVPASGNVSFTLTAICAGPAQWYFKPADNSGKLNPQIQAVSELGVFIYRVSDRGQPLAAENDVIYLPDQIIQVNVTNTDAVNPHTFDFGLTVPPG